MYNIISNAMSGKDADQIINRLWVGNYKSSLDLEFLKKNNINVIVNCTPDVPFYNEIYDDTGLQIETFRIPVYDSLLERDILLMEEYFKIVLPFLVRKYVIEKKNVLINCVAGAQRSAIVCAALLNVLIERDIIKSPSKSQDKKEQFKKITSFLMSRRPRMFAYGASVNFKNAYTRFFRLESK